MNCADFETLIALDVEGDLPGPERRAVAEHLLACHSCQRFVESLQTSQALLKELGQEPMDEPMVQEVHRRVQNGLVSETRAQRFPVWRWALGAAVIAALTFMVLIMRDHSPRAGTQIVAKKATPTNASLPSAASRNETRDSKIDARSAKTAQAVRQSSNNPSGSARRSPLSPAPSATHTMKRAQHVPSSKFSPGALRASANAPHPQPLTIKLITDNPNVVIYWLVD